MNQKNCLLGTELHQKKIIKRIDEMKDHFRRTLPKRYVDHWDLKLERMSEKDYVSLKDYLSGKIKPSSYTDGNPEFYSGISIEDTLDCLRRDHDIEKFRDVTQFGEFREGFEVQSRLDSTYFRISDISLKNYSERGTYRGLHFSPEGYIQAYDLYEPFFNLPKGSFSTYVCSPGCLTCIDEKSSFKNYWKLVLERNVPFFFDRVNLGKGPAFWNMGKTFLVNGIKF